MRVLKFELHQCRNLVCIVGDSSKYNEVHVPIRS